MDSSQAAPFALLGYWYEKTDDIKRAVGCYSKALLLDPCQPVAGRGLLRLANADSTAGVIGKAVGASLPTAGWAWRAMARQKALLEGNDNLAVVSYLKALRCKDIEHPEEEELAFFYASPSHPMRPSRDEISEVLAELAACYRRLGRYTAAIWSYHSAIAEAGDRVPSPVLCSCAQGMCLVSVLVKIVMNMADLLLFVYSRT